MAILDNVTDIRPTVEAAPTEPRAPKKHRWLPFVVMGGVVVVVILAVQYLPKPEPAPVAPPLRVQGTLELHGSYYEQGSSCVGTKGYDDIRYRTPVTVYDGTEVLGVGQLQLGQVSGVGLGRACGFQFSVTVPPGRDFYSVEISHRGRLSYSEEQVESPLRVSLG